LRLIRFAMSGPLELSEKFRVWDFGRFPLVNGLAAFKDSSLKLSVDVAVHFPDPALVTISTRGPVEPSALKDVLTMRISAIWSRGGIFAPVNPSTTNVTSPSPPRS